MTGEIVETLTLSRLATTGGNSGSRFHFASVSSISGEDTFSFGYGSTGWQGSGGSSLVEQGLNPNYIISQILAKVPADGSVILPSSFNTYFSVDDEFGFLDFPNVLAVDDYVITDFNTAITFDVKANDADLDGDPLSVELIDAPFVGSIKLLDDNRITYTPDTEFSGDVSFSYQLSDGINVAEAIATIFVEPELLLGTTADDNLISGNWSTVIRGVQGDDTITGGEGDDEIYGGDGNDTIYTSAGNDIYDGGAGIDTVITDYVNSPPTLGGNISLRNIENQFFIGETNITIDRSADPSSGDNHVKSESGDDRILLGVGDDTFELGSGKNYSGGGEGNDTIVLDGNGTFGSGFAALNISSSLQTGTEERINLNGKTRFEDVMDGGADVDTVELTDASDAFFLHDSFSGFHSSLTLSDDYSGKSGTARIESIENINAGGGDDIIDLTSPDYSLADQNITVDGSEGNDTLWGSDANETLKGGNGDDELFGGTGINELIGGSGADEFKFTETSSNDTVSDFSISDGDTLTFFNTGGAQFDRDSIALNSAGDELTIAYGFGVDDALMISLTNAGLQLDDLTADVLFIV